ncbi:hypothetical protein [Streptomyces antarcticus]|uniref:hypothetical protein n=1 Tax=Streptomyces antarcticus TaxID=2996458 RepID=UPI00226DA355|nr:MULTISPECIES: hypothetical protein [unclassified Streptomyces]MCY0941108.1 hypothetical protein [Streptomyces sp. H34-AA3]MCZ4084185.1 hypothetical protein [Streptomyces sp. H34-S5]
MSARARSFRLLSAAAVTAVLLAGTAGCGEKDRTAKGAASEPAAPPTPTAPAAPSSAPAAASASAPAPGGSPSGGVSAIASVPPAPSSSAGAAPPAAPAPRATTPPAAPTRLTVAVETRGGRLSLVRGGPAQEFTVTLRNGNTAAYRHLLVAFQMETLVDGSGGGPGAGPGFALERREPASGAWRPAALRVANDRMPPSLFTGGSALAVGEVRVERYRLEANAAGPAGSTPVVVSFIDTDADREAAGHVNIVHATR